MAALRPVDVLAVLDDAGDPLAPEGTTSRALADVRDAVAELIELVREDVDCRCRPETDIYEAHTCERCALLAKVGAA